MLMAKPGGKKLLTFSPLRHFKRLVRKRQRGCDKRFCILWINRMVNKEVEKRIAVLRSEFLLMNHSLREEMVAEIQEELSELLPEEVMERNLNHTELDQKQNLALRWIRRIHKQYREITEEDEEDEEDYLRTLNFSDTSSDSSSKPECKLEQSIKIVLDVSTHDTSDDDTSDDDTSDDDTSDDDTGDGDTSSQPARCEQEENGPLSSDVNTAAEPIQQVEGESSRTGVPADRTKEAEALLMERQWKEWMEKQEMRGNHNKEKQIDQIQGEKQGGEAPPVPKRQNAKPNTKQTSKQQQNVKHVGTVKKMKTYLSDFLNPHTFNRWERFDNED